MKYSVLSYNMRFFDRAIHAYSVYGGDTTIKRVASISGGKDSTAMLLFLCELRDRYGMDFEAVIADTGNEHQLTVDYVHELERRTGIPITWKRSDFSERIAKRRSYVQEHYEESARARILSSLHPTGIPFLDMCLWKGRFPSPCARFCTVELKVLPIKEYHEKHLSAGYTVESWQGIRAEESLNRKYLPKRNIEDENTWNVRPILRWKIEHVVALHRRHGIPLNPLYKMGFSRVGCFPCINERKKGIRQIITLFPETIDKIRTWEETVSTVSKRRRSTFFHQNRHVHMNTDIRLSVGFWQHPKTKKTVKRLGLEGIRSLQVLWLWAAQNRPEGNLHGMDEEEIELAADWQGEEGLFFKVCSGMWIDETPEGFSLHDWEEHNPWQAEAEARSEAARKAAKARWGNAKANEEHKEKEAAAMREQCAGNAKANEEQCPSPLLSSPLQEDSNTHSHAHARAKKTSEPKKLRFGENGNVLLTPEEHESLCRKFTPELTEKAISFLDLHIGAKGKDEYKSHNLAMQKWVFDAVKEREAKKARASPPSGSDAGRRSQDAAFETALARREARRNHA